MKYVLSVFHWPMIVLGYAYQTLAGGFCAGRMLATYHVRRIAERDIAERGLIAAQREKAASPLH